jgi:ABC-2 type transport system permease protein
MATETGPVPGTADGFGPWRRPVHPQLLFQGLRRRMLRNTWRALLGRPAAAGGRSGQVGNWTRPLTILVVSLFVATLVFGISLSGFWFLTREIHLSPDIGLVGLVLDLLFVTLGMLLVFSTGLILYGSLFTAPETGFLLSCPVRDDQVFAYKFQGAVAFSSWAFLLLGGPILLAYGLVCKAPWYYYLFLPVFFLGFVLIPGSLGSLAALVIVNVVPRKRKQLLLAILAVSAVALVVWIYSMGRTARRLYEIGPGGGGEAREMLTGLLGRLQFSSSILLPSHWVADGLRQAGRGRLDGAAFNLALVWSNGLLLYLGAAWGARLLYRRGYNRVATGGTLRRRYGTAFLDRFVERSLRWARPSTRLLIVKDFRTFRRDPQQWGQILLFGGLMVLYFSNVRRLLNLDIGWTYRSAVSFLNVTAVALLLCTYTGRFVYPLLSLEGRKFWVLGLLPVGRSELLWAKFAFASTGGVLASVGLVLLSDLMLQMPGAAVLLHVLTAVVLATGLAGLSVGLGACMPNFRETDPSKIAVGFGGTLNLVAGLLFLLLILGLMAGPWHIITGLAPKAQAPAAVLWPVTAAGVAAGVALGAAAVAIPLGAGIRALRRMEF